MPWHRISIPSCFPREMERKLREGSRHRSLPIGIDALHVNSHRFGYLKAPTAKKGVKLTREKRKERKGKKREKM